MALNGRSFLLEHIAHLLFISGKLYLLAMNYVRVEIQASWLYSEERFPAIGF
jgi:hypothetical protein